MTSFYQDYQISVHGGDNHFVTLRHCSKNPPERRFVYGATDDCDFTSIHIKNTKAGRENSTRTSDVTCFRLRPSALKQIQFAHCDDGLPVRKEKCAYLRNDQAGKIGIRALR